MKVLICGAGIAGLTLAWHLERSGWEVELVERAPAFRDGGYLIDFYGPGYEVAELMGLKPRLLEARYPVTELSYVDGGGRRTSHLTMPPDFSAKVVSVLRGDLARAIQDGVRSPVLYGASVEEVRQAGDGVAVRLTDGTERHVDLLVGADGAHSRVRGLVFGDEGRFLRHLGHHVAAYTMYDEVLSERAGRRYEMLTVPGTMAGAYALREGRIALLFLRREPDPAVPADPRAALLSHYGDLGWILPEALPHCPEPPRLYYDQVTQVHLDEWSRGRVVLLGDACHAVSLFAGHGASLAMAGAWILAGELAAGGDVAAALTRYQNRLQPTVTEVQRFGRRFVHWMAPSSQWRVAARDLMLRLAKLPGGGRLFLGALITEGSDLIRPARPVGRAERG
ncbi:FAD-dependent oxidoreductase [Nonomuraea lactucae]|uniref:FAD-dependent oxidoreductase n=1 Tax=Nonomuraea lactucae TaxID=2249762 RepID=UPI000DE47FFE|nr:FAD-dependent oxidoreductase [Nonomuraea lactucae]